MALIAVHDSSMDRIFRGRNLNYFSERYDGEVTQRTLALLAENEMEVIVAYHQEYDDLLHQTTPYSDEAVDAFRRHLADFVHLTDAVHRHWKGYNRMLLFAPDHGAHIDPHTGTGDHCWDCDEDMELIHLYGSGKKESR